jgi:predicted nucleotidyltransferase
MRERLDPARLRSRLRQSLAAHPEIDFAYIFGSYAVGMAYRDMEVAVFLRPAPALSTVLDYEMDLSVELTLALRVDVDVHVLNNEPPGFQHAVLQGRPLLVRVEERLIDFAKELGPEAMEFAYLDDLDLREVNLGDFEAYLRAISDTIG